MELFFQLGSKLCSADFFSIDHTLRSRTASLSAGGRSAIGLYHKKEAQILYDYDDIIDLINPRNVLIYSPKYDRFVDNKDIKNCIERVLKRSKCGTNIEFKNPDDICRFQKDQQDVVLEWLNNKLK